ncbi:hypothetical protein ACIA5C_18650 [Actinoplanes sp. NPDC051343]|uniref:hypothetical protein n=1 Tax=Actinoplanes sp. NPDC051343 TaxID=3363906 RepID=UPI0037AA0684
MKNMRDFVLGFFMLAGLCCVLALPRVVMIALPRSFQMGAYLGVFVLLLGLVARDQRRDRQALDRIGAWVSAGGWISVPAGRSWPWESLLRTRGTVTVKWAWQSLVDGLLITVGEAKWDDNALDGAVVGWAGKGVFVEVQLPVATEPMGIRRPHRTIGTSHRLDLPALHDAFENGEIPPFTTRDRSLFTFEAFEGRLSPASFDRLIERTLRIVRLLDLGPDTVRDH